MTRSDVLPTKEAMLYFYGSFFEKGNKQNLDKKKIPRNLHALVPYAEFWGVLDDGIREELVLQATPEVIANLKKVVRLFDNELDDWLAGEEANISPPSNEYVAFSAMRMAADFAL